MFIYKKSLLLLLIVFVFTSFVNTEKEWILLKNSNNVMVYSRNVYGQTIKELKSVTQIKTSLSSLVALLNDRESCSKWVYKCGKSYLIKQVSDQEYYGYQNVIAPWPVDNRDVVFNVRVAQNETTKEVILSAVSKYNYLPPVKDHVRIKTFNSTWILTPLKNGVINCVNQVLVDPGGHIPIWLINMVAVDGPYETTSNMRKLVLDKKYQSAQIEYIKELD